MTPVAQGGAGLALVMCFALLRTRQTGGAVLLLAVQSGAVAVSAVAVHQPLMAVPPAVLGGGIWLRQNRRPAPDLQSAPIGGAKLSIGVGTALAILCESQGAVALPLAIVLLSILLAATRAHPFMQVVALVAAQNGLVLAGCVNADPALLPATLLAPIACLVLPLPLAAALLMPGPFRFARSWTLGRGRAAGLLGWVDLGLAVGIFVATLIVPLDSLASVFAPLLGLDGVLRACVRRNRRGLLPLRRGAALLGTAFAITAVCIPDPAIAWLAVLAVIATALFPTLLRYGSTGVLAFLAAGLALFGILLMSTAPSILSYFSLFAGFAIIGGLIPDLAAVLVILILRLATQGAWPPGVEPLGIAITMSALLVCAVLLASSARSHRTSLLVLGQASIAALAIFVGEAEGRFAALVLLVLLVLTRSAARMGGGLAARLALAGLAGLPPLGVFPGLVLVMLTISAQSPWLLLPLGAVLIPMVLAGLPTRLPKFQPWTTLQSVAWLPLALALVVGYFAPDGLVHWWRALTAGRT